MLYKISCDSLLPTSSSSSHIILPLTHYAQAILTFFVLLQQDTLVPTLGLLTCSSLHLKHSVSRSSCSWFLHIEFQLKYHLLTEV